MQTEELTKGMTRVFVYGSLKQGHSNHGLLAKYRMVTRDYIEGPYNMYSLGYFPGVVEDTAEGAPKRRIYGEVYEVDLDGLASLDLLEGHPTFYCRHKVNTEGGVRVWVYLLQNAATLNVQQVVESGMWGPTPAEEEYWAGVEEDADGSSSTAA